MSYFVKDDARAHTAVWAIRPENFPEHSAFKAEKVEAEPKGNTEGVREPVDTSFMSYEDRQAYFPERSGRFSTASYTMTDDVIGTPRVGGWANPDLQD